MHELTLSRTRCSIVSAQPVYALVYPEDNYDERLARLAAANGYVLGFTEDWGNAGDSDESADDPPLFALDALRSSAADVAHGHAR